MKKQNLDLMQFYEGYVRNYRRLNLSSEHNRSMFTKREVDYFANVGEYLGFYTFVEDSKYDRLKGRSRPMDLSWWKWDQRKDKVNYLYLALHLERESLPNKDLETIEKLFSETEDGYVPHNVIGIQYIETLEKITVLNEVIKRKNKLQQSNVLMIYRCYDSMGSIERVEAYYFNSSGLKESRKAIAKVDETGHWFMSFEEEWLDKQS
ncbi:hypothetical protein D8M04_13385 [Oceanobacillus piezotolerans]|uniref:Uncharacterized protein n=1 Tax=Oceanobacillus piezotolerans TaxID=2448030 RepID=A0A498D7A1_9BACI|nr:hypothetical protein [Oceanobacillus piezotolerans]RLL43894.1 hypothetical protein D8M04_13385 [Oceanobacillus piezotolerans]